MVCRPSRAPTTALIMHPEKWTDFDMFGSSPVWCNGCNLILLEFSAALFPALVRFGILQFFIVRGEVSIFLVVVGNSISRWLFFLPRFCCPRVPAASIAKSVCTPGAWMLFAAPSWGPWTGARCKLHYTG